MNILLAIHHTPSPETIVDHVASLPWPAGCVARVVTVVEPAADGAQSATDGAQAGTHAAELLVEAAAARLRDAGLEASGAVLEGSPKTDIVEYAGYWRASLVLAGSHARHEPARRLFLGSIAQSIVRNAPCSVEIVRPPLSPRGTGQQGFRLLLATDGSDCSLAAAREVASRPWPAGSEVQVVSAVEILAAAIEPFFPGPRIVTQVQEESASISETAVREAAALLDASGLKTSVKLLKGDSKEQIVRYAREWHADLVVVGTHTRHGLSLLLEGSVSEAVALESECSVLVVREARA